MMNREASDFRQDLLDAIQETRTAFAKRNLSLPISMTFSDPTESMEFNIKQSFQAYDFTIDPVSGPFDFEKGVKIMGMEIKIKGDHDE